jgi:hypothetical protein
MWVPIPPFRRERISRTSLCARRERNSEDKANIIRSALLSSRPALGRRTYYFREGVRGCTAILTCL